MIVSQEEQDKILREFIDSTTKDLIIQHITEVEELLYIKAAKQYAKWYAEKVIDRCAEVAKLCKIVNKKYLYPNNPKKHHNIGYNKAIDKYKQSIKKVKEEL